MRIQLEKKKTPFALAFVALIGQGLFLQAQEQTDTQEQKIMIPAGSFADQGAFDQHWNYLYAWGEDHNGSARMKQEQVKIENSELHITADRLTTPEGRSTKDPHLPIVYHSGAIHSKALVKVDDTYPMWELSGSFKAPIQKGTWPAFWITGSETWPPESDILEFKGDNINWQNTVKGKDWRNTDWQTEKTEVATADKTWHRYTLIMRKIDEKDVELQYYIDDELKASHTADFVGKPFHVIVNLQMEGASGPLRSGPEQAVFKAKDIEVKAYKNIKQKD